MLTVQVKSVRGSGIATVAEVAPDGSLLSRENTLAVKFPKHCKGAALPGSVWGVSGDSTERSYSINGFPIHETLLIAKHAEFIRPSGELLARWIHRNVEGIGEVIARRLVRAFPNIDEVTRDGDLNALLTVSGMTEPKAQALITNWPSESLYDVLEWLQRLGLPMGLADRLMRVYGDEAIDTLKDDPFLLLAFDVPFEQIMALIETQGFAVEEEQMLAGVAEHVVNRYSLRTGSTVISESQLLAGAREVLGDNDTASVVNAGLKRGALISVETGFQGVGAAVMERSVARFLVNALQRLPGAGSMTAGWERGCNETAIAKALEAFEATLPFAMTLEQRAAVMGAVSSPVCAISGGAGTGKTTILQALLGVYDAVTSGLAIYQVALSGRAAQRMTESTGRPATTIAKLLADHLGDGKPPLPDHILLVVDEASMVDLLSAYKLVGILPVATRVVFVGDVAQLPPVGGGLVFHALMDNQIPVFHLTQVKRQGQDSGIHKLASVIRNGAFEAPPKAGNTLSESPDCCHILGASPEQLERTWRHAGGQDRCIILSPTRKGPSGVDTVNKLIQESKGLDRPLLRYKDDLRGWIPWVTRRGTNLLYGDQVMVTANDYDLDIRNGDLGIITAVYDAPSDEGDLGILIVNGNEVPVTKELLQNLDLGYAITIHKSQGSQWPVCILLMPSYATHMLDQTLTYTAVTRPSEQLVIMGDLGVLDAAVKRGSIALQRQTNLAEYLSCPPS